MIATGYQIGALKIRFETNFEVSESHSYALFRDNGEESKVRVTYKGISKPPESMGEPIFIDDVKVYDCKTSFCRELVGFSGQPIAWAYIPKEALPSIIECFYLNEAETELRADRQLFKLVGLGSILSCFDCLILHAAYIIHNGEAILFSAPSQTGKSTQAELWQGVEDARIINGDRAIIRLEGDRISVCGLPFSGTSGHCLNESAPLRAIAVLEQAPQDSCERLRAAEAYKRLFSQTAMLPFDRRFLERTADLLFECLKRTPIFLLRCTPTAKAVETLKRAMEGEA